MSKSEFRDKFLPLNTEDDVVYGWYLTKNYDWRVFKLGLCEDNTGWIYSNRPGLKLKAVTHGRNDILFYDYGNERDLDVKDIYGNFLDIVVDDGCVKQLDTGGFSWDGEHTSERQLDAKVKQRTWGSEPIMYDFSSELECSYKIPVSYMTNPKYVEHFEQMLDIHEIYYTKNQDYGDAFTESIDEFGPMAALVRMTDKMSRLKNLLNTDDGYILDESVDDTLIDLANYAIMTALHLRRKAERDKHTDD